MKEMSKARKVYADVCREENCVSEVFTDLCRFFYIVECNENETVEWGFGYIEDGELIREHALYFMEDRRKSKARNYRPYNFPEGAYVVLKSYIPESVEELMSIPHSVICSQGAGVTVPVELEGNTLLGNYGGSIQSIDSKEFIDMMGDPIKDAICATKSPLTLNTDVFDLHSPESRVAASLIWARPRKKPDRAQPGMIIFDSSTKRFLGYNGLAWIELG